MVLWPECPAPGGGGRSVRNPGQRPRGGQPAGPGGALAWGARHGAASWRLMARTPDFDAWLIAWPSGGKVELHDHGTFDGGRERDQRRARRGGALARRHGPALPGPPRTPRGPRSASAPGMCTMSRTSRTARSEPARLQPRPTTMTFYESAGERLVVREVAWTDDGSGEFEERTTTSPRLGTGGTGGGLPLTADDHRVTARSADDLVARGPPTDRAGRAGRARAAPGRAVRSWSTSGRPPSAPAEGELGFGLVVERNVLEWRFDLTGTTPCPRSAATTSQSWWCARRDTRPAWPPTRCASWVSPTPPTWRGATRRGAAGVGVARRPAALGVAPGRPTVSTSGHPGSDRHVPAPPFTPGEAGRRLAAYAAGRQRRPQARRAEACAGPVTTGPHRIPRPSPGRPPGAPRR